MKILGALAAVAVLSTSAFAADDVHLNGRFGLGLGVGAPWPMAYSAFRNTTDIGWMLEGHGDMYLSDAFGLEALFQHNSYQRGQPLNNFYTLGFNYRTIPQAHITPVLGLAAGWGTSTDKTGLDIAYSSFVAVGKVAVDFAVGDDVMLELGAKYSWLFSKNDGRRDQQALIPNFSMTYFFGGSHQEGNDRPVPAATPAPAPSAAPVAQTDGDDDQDGVLNSVDRCPGTPVGAKVNSFGCQVTEAVNERVDIEFKTGKSTIPATYFDEANKIVDMMRTHADVNAEIQGYTDNVGTAAKNQKLSEARANSVRTYIVKHGIDSSRITAKGYGEENPVADNATAEGRKQNRRVNAELKSK